MRFKFSDIDNNILYSTTRVLFLTGPYSIFNNIVADRLKNMCKGTIEVDEDEELLAEFGLVSVGNDSVANSIDFNTFLEVVRVPAVTGKWFCSVDYKMLTRKQRDILDRYMKKPNDNGVLIVVMNEYQDYRSFIKNKAIINHTNTHLIQLSYPNRSSMIKIVSDMMKERGVKVAQKAIELFIMRMSTNYDEYEQVIDDICKHANGNEITYKDMVSSMRNVEYYVIDDFVTELLNPITSRRISQKRRIYKMLGVLIEDMGAIELVKKLKYKINDIIEMRVAINRGIVPIKVAYSVDEAKSRLEENNKLKNVNDYAFRRYALIASKTTLRDWLYIKLILNNIKRAWDKDECEKALHCIIHRGLMSSSRLLNDIGISNIIDEQLYNVNSVFFKV